MAGDFRFKQFVLTQGQSAFKLGTDSVLLGCWAGADQVKSALDIGTGTGILSLMLAQRFTDVFITAIELDAASSNDCANNFALSPWKDRLHLVNNNIIDWSLQHAEEKFDLIITNPPYFINSLPNDNDRKTIARHNVHLSHSTLASLVRKHLKPEGKFGCILPKNEFASFTIQLLKEGLSLNKVLRISSFHGSEIIRELGMFSFQSSGLEIEEEFLYNTNHSRSDWYSGITQEFYIR